MKLSYKEIVSKVSQWCIDIPAIQDWIANFTPTTFTTTKCVGPFVQGSNASGRLAITSGTQMFGNNVTGDVLDWTEIFDGEAPDCITDVTFDTLFGDVITYHRRCRIYLWADVRYTRGGVTTLNTRRYQYSDERTEGATVEGLQYEMEDLGDNRRVFQNVPGGTPLKVEIRIRGRMAAAQTSSWARVYGPYRAQASVVTIPRELVTEVQ